MRKAIGLGILLALLGRSIDVYGSPGIEASMATALKLGFVRPFKKMPGDDESCRDIFTAKDRSWSLINYISDRGKSGSLDQGLWFKGAHDQSFRRVATYYRLLKLAINNSDDWVLFACAPGSGESNAFLLPISSFNSETRTAKPVLPGANVDFQDINSHGFVDLLEVCKSKIPRSFVGRTMTEVAWLNDDEVGIFVWARNREEDDDWRGCFIYSLGNRTVRSVPHLPIKGLDWLGNQRIPDGAKYIDGGN